MLPRLNQVTLLREDTDEKLIWMHNVDGNLSLKEGYSFHRPAGISVSWYISI